jgi:hypothetical protein
MQSDTLERLQPIEHDILAVISDHLEGGKVSDTVPVIAIYHYFNSSYSYNKIKNALCILCKKGLVQETSQEGDELRFHVEDHYSLTEQGRSYAE